MALISFTVTAKLICAFVVAYAKYWFSHEVVHIVELLYHIPINTFKLKLKSAVDKFFPKIQIENTNTGHPVKV